jgi:hypothetical protein
MSRIKEKNNKKDGFKGNIGSPVKMRSIDEGIDEGIVLWYCVEK